MHTSLKLSLGFACFALSACGTSTQGGERDDFGMDPMVLPRTSRSEVVELAPVFGSGVRLSVSGDQRPAAFVIHHADDEQVLRTNDGLVLVGAPRPVRRVTGADPAWLARQDGLCVHAGPLEFTPPTEAVGLSLVLIAGKGGRICVDDADGGQHVSGSGSRGGLILPGGHPLVLSPSGPNSIFIDQAFYAVSRPLPRSEWVPCPLPGEAPTVAPGTLAEGRSWTLILERNGADYVWIDPELEVEAREATLFQDVSSDLGVQHTHLEGPDLQLDIRPTMGPGAAWGDIDGDGWVDLYLVQGAGRPGMQPLGNRLYRNVQGERFEEISVLAGVADSGAGMGALFFDADGDGDLDLYVSNYGRDKLYENLGERTFADRSAALPGHDLWSAGICAGDIDADGDLDLYVTSYLDYDLDKLPPVVDRGSYSREDPIEMLPFAFPGQRNVLLRNDSAEDGLAFTDVTEAAGVLNENGLGMQAVFWDFDHDRDLDLYVANDVTPNALFRNAGDGTFEDVGFSVGLDDPRGGMGLALGDVDRDGDEDLFLTNWELETNALYLSGHVAGQDRKTRRANFRDGTVAAGLGPAGIGRTGWGAVLFDLENDGDLDLFVANGYTSPDYESTGICVGQPNALFRATRPGKFTDISARAGTEFSRGFQNTRSLPSRGAAGCDFDRDGRVDLIVTTNNGPAQVLRNQAAQAEDSHWVLLRLSAKGKNPYAIGAVVTLEYESKSEGPLRQRRSLLAGSGYLTGAAPELHFGLGQVQGGVRATVEWPSGAASEHELEGLDRVLVLREE